MPFAAAAQSKNKSAGYALPACLRRFLFSDRRTLYMLRQQAPKQHHFCATPHLRPGRATVVSSACTAELVHLRNVPQAYVIVCM